MNNCFWNVVHNFKYNDSAEEFGLFALPHLRNARYFAMYYILSETPNVPMFVWHLKEEIPPYETIQYDKIGTVCYGKTAEVQTTETCCLLEVGQFLKIESSYREL